MEIVMPLISFTSRKEDAPQDAIWDEHHKVWIWYTHRGLCIRDYERNGYDDSDFYMVVWSEEKNAPETICYATTRGWSYPAMASCVDATKDVIEKYKTWQKEQDELKRKRDRSARAKLIRANRTILKDAAERHDMSFAEVLKFRSLPDWQKLLKLFNKRIRSGFKISLRNQIIQWCRNSSSQYSHPLSMKQRQFV